MSRWWRRETLDTPTRARLLELTSKNEQLLARDGERVARIEQLSALNAELAAKIEQVERVHAERAAQLDELSARSAMDRPLAFMHIPKTSGTALTAGLCEVLPSTACIVGFDQSAFGAFDSFETVAPEMREVIFNDRLPPVKGTDFVTGHIAYSTLAKCRSNARFMTILREPRSRVLSSWLFWRSISNDVLKGWGTWGDTIRLARRPLVDFLTRPEAACITDNISVRMLLWPHPLIPDGGFIDSASDQRLIDDAAVRLKSFDFADVIENPQFEENVRTFFARPFVYRRVNQAHIPRELRVPLQDELTSGALQIIEHRSRLDRQLWLALVAERIAGAQPAALSDNIFRRTVTRYTALMTS